MFNLYSTNDVFGWLVAYAVHLYYRSGITGLTELIGAINASTNRAFRASLTGNTAMLSDNECIMLSNRWFYAYVQGMGWYAGDNRFLPKRAFWDAFKVEMLKYGVEIVEQVPE